MNVPVDMVLWLDPLLHRVQQLHTPGPHPRGTVVPITHGGRVRHQDVRALGDIIPLVEEAAASRKVEGPSAVLGLPGGAVDVEAEDVGAGVLQVGAVGQVGFDVLLLRKRKTISLHGW